MSTDNERKALWFLAVVALSGGAVRLWRAGGAPPDAAAAHAVDHQIARVDSARAAGPASRRSRATGRTPAAREPRTGERAAAAPAAGPLDLDRADAATIEQLPGVGPALAARIVANRDSSGAFGAVEALCDVRGIGPALVERLRPLVTFTGPRRPVSDECGGASGRARRRPAAHGPKPR